MVQTVRLAPKLNKNNRKNLFKQLFLLFSIILIQILSFFKTDSFLFVFAFLSLLPVLFLVKNSKPVRAAIFGLIAGAISLSINASWLGSYHPIGIVIGMLLGAFWFGFAFLLSSIIFKTGSKYAAMASAFVWVLCEWGRSYGFVAFPYEALAYSQSERKLAYSIAAFGGTNLLGLLIALSGASLFYALNFYFKKPVNKIRGTLFRAAFALLLIAMAIFYGKMPRGNSDGSILLVNPGDEQRPGYFRVALLQPCIKKQKTVEAYNNAFDKLSALSIEAVKYKPKLVVWHETAIVPPIEWHFRYRPNREVYELTARIKSFLDEYPIPILTGNAYVPPEDDRRQKEYNSAILYKNGKPEQHYSKIKLVPFSEYLPSFLNFDFISRPIIAHLGGFWNPGSDKFIFRLGSASFASPICFEDSFGSFLASFDNPDFFVVLTNDSWANSEYMQQQHLAMSRFRAAETASIIIRAADTGSTSAVNGKGSVIHELKSMEPGILALDIKLGVTKKTFYEQYHLFIDLLITAFAIFFTVLAMADKKTAA